MVPQDWDSHSSCMAAAYQEWWMNTHSLFDRTLHNITDINYKLPGKLSNLKSEMDTWETLTQKMIFFPLCDLGKQRNVNFWIKKKVFRTDGMRWDWLSNFDERKLIQSFQLTIKRLRKKMTGYCLLKGSSNQICESLELQKSSQIDPG